MGVNWLGPDWCRYGLRTPHDQCQGVPELTIVLPIGLIHAGAGAGGGHEEDAVRVCQLLVECVEVAAPLLAPHLVRGARGRATAM